MKEASAVVVFKSIFAFIIAVYLTSAIALFIAMLSLHCDALGEFKRRHPELQQWKYKRFHTDVVLLLLFCMIPLLNTLLFLSIGGSTNVIREVLVTQLESEHGFSSSV